MDKLNDLFTKIITKLNKKVDSVEGKQLSTEDYTKADKQKVDSIVEGAEANKIDIVKVNGIPLVPDAQKAVDIGVNGTTFQGILPVDKGGTGRTDGTAQGVVGQRIPDGADVNNYKDVGVYYKYSKKDTVANYPYSSGWLIVYRMNPTEYIVQIAIDYFMFNNRSSSIKLRVGPSDWSDWTKIANLDDVPTKTSQLENDSKFITQSDYATASKAGLVKPGTGLSISDDGTLSLSQETLQQMIDDAVQKALSQ